MSSSSGMVIAQLIPNDIKTESIQPKSIWSEQRGSYEKFNDDDRPMSHQALKKEEP